MFSHLLAEKENDGNERDIAELLGVSPVAWQNVNLHGRFEFSKGPQEIDINAIIQQFEQIQLTSVITPTPEFS